MFINISNHPSDQWSDTQRDAALALVGIGGLRGESIVDVPFPQVHPEWETEHLERLADEIVAQLPSAANGAMVSGEYILTVALVLRLQKRGIDCYAATTVREVTLNNLNDKVSTFNFKRFRKYPSLKTT